MNNQSQSKVKITAIAANLAAFNALLTTAAKRKSTVRGEQLMLHRTKEF
jgi:hypothetical protein